MPRHNGAASGTVLVPGSLGVILAAGALPGVAVSEAVTRACQSDAARSA